MSSVQVHIDLVREHGTGYVEVDCFDFSRHGTYLEVMFHQADGHKELAIASLDAAEVRKLIDALEKAEQLMLGQEVAE